MLRFSPTAQIFAHRQINASAPVVDADRKENMAQQKDWENPGLDEMIDGFANFKAVPASRLRSK
jgi:hypothetical protein